MNNLIPMVVEQSSRVKELMIFIQGFLKERIIFLVGPINDNVASLVTAQLIIFRIRRSKKRN